MKHYKQLLAGILAGVMVLGSSVVALADNGGTTGQGQLDIVKDADIFSVVLPTTPEAGSPSQFDYIIDPTGVIQKTTGAKYAGKTFDPAGTVFFLDSDAAGTATDYNYKTVSEDQTATNKSTVDVELSVTVKVAAPEDIKLVAKNDLALANENNEKRLYIGYKDNKTKTTPDAITAAEGITLTTTLDNADDQYEVKYSAEKGYYKEAKSDATFAGIYTFSLEGACNTVGWDATVTPPTIEAVWSIENPVVTGPQMTITSGGFIKLSDLTPEKNYSSIVVEYGEGKSATLKMSDHTVDSKTFGWNATDGGTVTIQLNDNWLKILRETGKPATFTLNLKDGSTIVTTVTIA